MRVNLKRERVMEIHSGPKNNYNDTGEKNGLAGSFEASKASPGGSTPEAEATSDRLKIIEHLIAKQIKPKQTIFSTFKNRILVSTLLVVIGAVVIIGISLQITVFPKLRGDDAVIRNIKLIHFLASAAIIALSWLFIERISKTISSPLLDLTKRADEISKKAGLRLAATDQETSSGPGSYLIADIESSSPQDEIGRLTSSIDRMLAHLKASETMLRESEEKYRFLFDNGPSPIFVLDAKTTRILDVNARAEEEYRYSREELLSKSFFDLGMHSDGLDSGLLLRNMLVSNQDTPLPVLHHKRKDGSVFLVNFHARISRYQNRPAVMVAVWDVTETLEQHSKLIQTGKMATLGEMATGIAHELNQPLNVIQIGCDFLTKRIKKGDVIELEELRYVADQLNSSVQRASKIINHLREFGRKTGVDMGATDIREAVTNVFSLVGSQLRSRGIKWELDFEDNLPTIMGDVNRLEQVFINLILNARDAMASREDTIPDGKTDSARVLSIKAFRENSRLSVTVSDTGTGIPAGIADRVFDPFFTTKRRGEGTGLGLSISYGIVKDHRGTIELLRSQGRGATFKLTFPILSNGESDGKNSLGR